MLLATALIVSKEKSMVWKIIRDTAKAIALGILVGVLLFAVLWTGGTLAGGFRIRSGLETARAGMFIGGALGLFILAGSNLFYRKRQEWKHKDAWKKMYSVISYKTVIGVVSIVVLVMASFLDYMLYYV